MKLFHPTTKLFSIIALCFIFFAGCKKNDADNGGGTPSTPPDLSTKVNAALISGFVTNENNLPVLNAQVQIGTASVTTDKYGYFEVRNIDVVKTAATVTVTKTGYFKGIKTFVAEQGKSAFFRIKLIPKTITGNVNGGTGGAVTLTNGMSVTFPANAIVNAVTNAAYTGTVNVAAYWINPTSNDVNSVMPGDLRGLNTDGNLQLLTTYGMAAVELTGTGGELLQIATGKNTSLSLPIPASILANAPATIPLWYFDEAKGLWKQEGIATKTGSNYVGDVSHFSFWNYDAPANYVIMNCTVINTVGQPIRNALVKVTQVSNPANYRYGYTDSSGYVSGAVPNNSQLLLEIFASNTCVTPNHSQNFTTTNANISLGNITVSNTSAIATISGNVVNCNGQPVTNGFIIVNSGNIYNRYPLNNIGSYSVNVMLCGNTNNNPITLIGEDVTAGQQSTPAAYAVNSGSNAIPTIQACGVNTQQYIYYTINGTSYSFNAPIDSLMYWRSSPSVFISGIRSNSNFRLYFDFTSIGIAAGSTQYLSGFYPLHLNDSTRILTPIPVNISEYGVIGQYVSGTFSGLFTGNSPANTQYNINCSFRLRRSI
jgi:hypothetical protein